MLTFAALFAAIDGPPFHFGVPELATFLLANAIIWWIIGPKLMRELRAPKK